MMNPLRNLVRLMLLLRNWWLIWEGGDMGHPPQGGPLDLGVTETPPSVPTGAGDPPEGGGQWVWL